MMYFRGAVFCVIMLWLLSYFVIISSVWMGNCNNGKSAANSWGKMSENFTVPREWSPWFFWLELEVVSAGKTELILLCILYGRWHRSEFMHALWLFSPLVIVLLCFLPRNSHHLVDHLSGRYVVTTCCRTFVIWSFSWFICCGWIQWWAQGFWSGILRGRRTSDHGV